MGADDREPAPDLNSEEKLLERARKLRAVAAISCSPFSRKVLLDVAAEYELMAAAMARCGSSKP